MTPLIPTLGKPKISGPLILPVNTVADQSLLWSLTRAGIERLTYRGREEWVLYDLTGASGAA